MVIARKLAHKVQNELQTIMGYIDLGIIETEKGHKYKADEYFVLAKTTIRKLSILLNARIKEDHDMDGKKK